MLGDNSLGVAECNDRRINGIECSSYGYLGGRYMDTISFDIGKTSGFAEAHQELVDYSSFLTASFSMTNTNGAGLFQFP